jgi:hypothetical protein
MKGVARDIGKRQRSGPGLCQTSQWYKAVSSARGQGKGRPVGSEGGCQTYARQVLDALSASQSGSSTASAKRIRVKAYDRTRGGSEGSLLA